MSFVSLCRQFGISRKTGYKREDRFQRYGWEGFGDWSRTPRRRPNRTSLAVAERLIEVRRAYPNWGPKKVMAWLRTAEPEGSWPAPSTAGDVLDRAGLVRRRKRRRHAAPWSNPFGTAESPNDVWSIDLKGWFRTGDGTRIDPLTAQDAATCYLLVCDELQRPNRREAHRVLERTFRQTYNTERPHEALGQQPSASQDHRSARSYPRRVTAPEYGVGVTVRQVRTNAQIKWKGNRIYLSEALKGEPVGLVPQDDRSWTIWFGPLSIGLLDDHNRSVLHTPTKVLPMSLVAQ